MSELVTIDGMPSYSENSSRFDSLHGAEEKLYRLYYIVTRYFKDEKASEEYWKNFYDSGDNEK